MYRWFFFLFVPLAILLAGTKSRCLPENTESALMCSGTICNPSESCFTDSPSVLEREIRFFLDGRNACPIQSICLVDNGNYKEYKFLRCKPIILTVCNQPYSTPDQVLLHQKELGYKCIDYYIYALRRIQR